MRGLGAVLSLCVAVNAAAQPTGRSFSSPVVPAPGANRAPGTTSKDNVSPVGAEPLAKAAAVLSLKIRKDGSVVQEGVNPRTKVPYSRPLAPAAAQRVRLFLSRLPAEDPEAGMVLALKSYLRSRMDPRDLEDNLFLKRDERGVLRLTPTGKNALMDILEAEDGQLLAEASIQPTEPAARAPAGQRRGALPDMSGSLAAVGGAGRAPGAAFDGNRQQIAGFDWKALDRELKDTAGLKSVGDSVLNGYAVDRDANTVRVIVAAAAPVARDRLGAARGGEVPSPHQERAAIYKESGLDQKLMDRHGAKVVRAVDNLVVIDVPLQEAAALGLTLEKKGVSSKPARLFRAFAVTAAVSPVTAVMGQFSPVPPEAVKDSLLQGLGPKNLESRGLMRIGDLWKRGMEGEGSTVGIIDTGIDASHPDFKGKIKDEDYVDFTGEGKEDPIGHGTHVAGSVGGSGEASEGAYKGMAPKTRFLVAKVFGTKGEASEDVILAAMKWMEEKKPDIVNMSLGGPGEPNKDPLGAMANRMTVKDNILVVVAAGNEGPMPGTIGSPGNARYALTVTGVNKEGQFSFFPSRGPVEEADGNVYIKPDISTIAGDVLLPPQPSLLARLLRTVVPEAEAAPHGPNCVYGPGVISARSGADGEDVCVVEGNPRYRFMSGTSMATPMAAGVAANVIGYAKSKGAPVRAVEVKAAMMETAADLRVAREVQGAGLVQGDRLAAAVVERVGFGIPIGNVAYALALRMINAKDRETLKTQARYQETALGLLDTKTGRLVNTEREMDAVVRKLRRERAARPAALVAARRAD